MKYIEDTEEEKEVDVEIGYSIVKTYTFQGEQVGWLLGGCWLGS
jgi:hypothetical protein